MEAGNKIRLFNRNGCLSRYALYAYTSNSLSRAEMEMIEEHLRKCELCSEAIKGYKKHHQSVLFKNDLHFLSRRIRDRYNKQYSEQKRSLLFLAYVVISVVILLILVFLIYRFYQVSG